MARNATAVAAQEVGNAPSYQVGEVITRDSIPGIHRTSEYEDLFAQASELDREDQSIPVTFTTKEAAVKFQRAARQRGHRAEKRGAVIFLGRLQPKAASDGE